MAKEPKHFRPKPRRPRGFEDLSAEVLTAERDLVARAGSVYEAHGFAPLATGAFEYADALGKFLPDEERPNEGVFALQDDDEQWMALRYDLTAPLARYVAENFDSLPKPFRRWQTGTVWRNEKPGPGRFREFTQCDADTVGAAGPAADAEMILLAVRVMQAVGLSAGDFVIRVNDRRLLDGVLEKAGVGDATQKVRVLRSLDKLDKFGWDGVVQLLGAGRKDESGDFTAGAGLTSAQMGPIRALVESGKQASTQAAFGVLADAVAGSAGGEAAVKDMEAIASLLGGVGLKDEWAFDTSVVRGLGYYTGPVFEAELLKTATYEDGAPTQAPPEASPRRVRFGSVGGGGRYDDLVARFTGQAVPATGFSFGVSRFAAALRALNAGQARAFRGPVVVLSLEEGQGAAYFRMAQEIRDRLGVPAEVFVGGGRNMGKQLKYADRRGAPVAVIMGSNEREAGQVTVKNLALGAEIAESVASREEWREQAQQETVARDDMVAAVARALGHTPQS